MPLSVIAPVMVLLVTVIPVAAPEMVPALLRLPVKEVFEITMLE